MTETLTEIVCPTCKATGEIRTPEIAQAHEHGAIMAAFYSGRGPKVKSRECVTCSGVGFIPKITPHSKGA
jgi:hypothetical protein